MSAIILSNQQLSAFFPPLDKDIMCRCNIYEKTPPPPNSLCVVPLHTHIESERERGLLARRKGDVINLLY